MSARKRPARVKRPVPARRAPTPRGLAQGKLGDRTRVGSSRMERALTLDPAEYVKGKIRAIADFPKQGILFRDITPVLADAKAFQIAVNAFVERLMGEDVDCIVGIESRGFLFAAPLARALALPLILVRKPGKLPGQVNSASYQLEYGEGTLEAHSHALEGLQRAVIVDDLLATGGTASAAAALIQRLGAEVVAHLFLVELDGLQGRTLLTTPVFSLIHFD